MPRGPLLGQSSSADDGERTLSKRERFEQFLAIVRHGNLVHLKSVLESQELDEEAEGADDLAVKKAK
jgi:hypothetical protein